MTTTKKAAKTQRNILTAIAAALIIIAYGICLCKRTSASDFTATKIETVREGDTLWRMAGKHCPEDFDKREYIQMVVDYNVLGENAYIYPGQTIYFLEVEK